MPEIPRVMCVKLLGGSSVSPKLSVTILLTLTKGSYSYFIKLTLERERHHSFSAWYNLFKMLTKYRTGNFLLHGIISMAIALVVLGSWFDMGICLHRLDSDFFPFKPELFLFTLGVLHLSVKPVISPAHWFRGASFPSGKPQREPWSQGSMSLGGAFHSRADVSTGTGSSRVSTCSEQCKQML